MKKPFRVGAILVALFLILVLVGPFLVPVRPLENTLSPEELADSDSRFLRVNDLQVHFKAAGEGRPALVLLHGFSASTFSWRKVMESLAADYTVIAYDRPAFGLTERPMPGRWLGENPYSPEAQADLTVALLEALGIDRAVLIGNSAGGTIAVLTALRHPDRVEALVLVDPAIYSGGGAPGWIEPLLRTPQMRHLGPLISRALLRRGDRLLRMAWHDPSKLTSDDLAGYAQAARIENWDRALWEFTLASHPLDLDQQLNNLRMPILVITGDDDRIVPTAESLRLASELPNAELVVIPACGHVPQEECPEAFLSATRGFLSRLP